MAETLVRFRQWVFSVDKAATEAVYAAASASEAVRCGCQDCLNFEAARELAFPPEVLALFAALGVDYHYEGEVYAVPLAPGYRRYGGWFHFQGAILEGPDLFVAAETTGTAVATNWAQLTDSFSLGFTTGSAPGIFSNLHHTVQIEIDTILPWLLADIPELD